MAPGGFGADQILIPSASLDVPPPGFDGRHSAGQTNPGQDGAQAHPPTGDGPPAGIPAGGLPFDENLPWVNRHCTRVPIDPWRSSSTADDPFGGSGTHFHNAGAAH